MWIIGEGEVRGTAGAKQHVLLVIHKWKCFLGPSAHRAALGSHWSEWCHMTSSSWGWRNEHGKSQVGREVEMAMDVEHASLKRLS